MQIITIDIVTLTIGIVLFAEIKRRRPQLFFLSEGANILLPPK